MSHTPEPWATNGNGVIHSKHPEWRAPWAISVGDTGRRFPDDLESDNARRIVACVNACAGNSTAWLEGYGQCLSIADNAKPFRELIDSVNAERDTYRELCGELLDDLKSQVAGFGSMMGKKSLADSEELIAKAEKLLGENNGTSN